MDLDGVAFRILEMLVIPIVGELLKGGFLLGVLFCLCDLFKRLDFIPCIKVPELAVDFLVRSNTFVVAVCKGLL